MEGRRVGNFRLEELIGQGGSGTVYRALDTVGGRTVAVKQLSFKLTARDADFRRFQREGDALLALDHPNIVRLLDRFDVDGAHYLVMAYVPGGDLRQKLGKPQQPAIVIRYGINLADALTRAHKLGIIHRDVKPGNILIAADGTLKLADFGVAYMAMLDRITQVQTTIGTLHYMAPEVISGGEPDARADMWSLGVVLYELLTGRLPFDNPSRVAMLAAIVQDPLPDPARFAPDAPAALLDLLRRMLTKDPSCRIATASDVALALRSLRERLPKA